MRPPDSYAETPEGMLLLADGLGPVMRWDGSSAELLPVGVTPPADGCTLAADPAVTDPRPAAPLTACTIVKDPAAAAPSLPPTPSAPTLAIDHSHDEDFTGGSDPTSYSSLYALKGNYKAHLRWQNARGDWSAWSAVSATLAVPRVDGSPYPPNVFALKYSVVALPPSNDIVRRQLALNPDLRTASVNNVIGAGDTAYVNFFVDVDSADVAATEFRSTESVYRATVAGPMKTIKSATKVTPGDPPADPVSLTGSYYAVVRYYDAFGRYSDFSPVSAVLLLAAGDLAYGLKYTAVPVSPDPDVVGRQILRTVPGSTTNFYLDVDTADLTATEFAGVKDDIELLGQDPVTDGVPTPGLSGSYWAYVRFVNELGQPSNLSPISGELAIGDDDFVYGVTYSGVPVPTQGNVVRRQILRNTSGQATTFYVDVDSIDLTATTFSSTRSDDELDDQEAVPLASAEGVTLANRYTVPPAHKTALSTHQGRGYMAVDRVWDQGGVYVQAGGQLVAGLNTDWVEALAGRMLYVAGHGRYYQITGVDEAGQTLMLSEPYEGGTDKLASYQIRPAPAERRLVYYTAAGEMESWLASNALEIPEDSDELTGLMQMDSFLFVLERRHIWRFTCQSDPAVDGFVFLSANRGCLNNRCFATVGGTSYMLDEQGVHAFDGSDPKDVSGPIQAFFLGSADGPSINWAAAQLFHASLHVDETAVRFFVCMSGEYAPRHALCYDYTADRWWLEEYDRPVAASTAGTVQSRRRAFFGSSAERTYLSHESLLDGVAHDAGRTRGRVTSAGLYRLADLAGGWPAQLVGQSVAIVSGKGSGQRRTVIAQGDTELLLKDPWLVIPDRTSVYQLGGVPWRWLSGWLRWGKDEEEVPRKFEIVYRRTLTRRPNLAAALVTRVYRDFSSAAVVWKDKNRDSDAEGFACEKGGVDLVAVMDRDRCYAQQRMPGMKELNIAGNRYVSFGVEGVSGDSPQAVYQIAVDGVEG